MDINRGMIGIESFELVKAVNRDGATTSLFNIDTKIRDDFQSVIPVWQPPETSSSP